MVQAPIHTLSLGTLAFACHGIDFPLVGPRMILERFATDLSPDVSVDISNGGLSEWEWRRSEVLSWHVDNASRRVRMEMQEWTATFDMPGRHVEARLGGPWPRAVETLLKVAVQLFGLGLGRGLTFHSSSVDSGGRGYVFTGRSESGKSTAARLSEETGRTVLTEEITFVGPVDGSAAACVHPLPVWNKSGLLAQPVAVPLRAIYALEQAAEDRVEEIPRGEQVRRLAVAASIGVRHRLFMERALDLAEQLVERVPVHVLHFRKSPDFWDVIEPGGGAD
jgi:hypothetical protein